MATNQPYIDSFLDAKLNDISALPNEDTWAQISNHIQHLQNPVDAGLNNLLANYEEGPNAKFSQLFLNELPQNIHVIDIALHQKLETVAYQPNSVAWQNIQQAIGGKKKRRFALWLVLLPLMVGGVLVCSYFYNNSISKKDTLDKTTYEVNTDNLNQSSETIIGEKDGRLKNKTIKEENVKGIQSQKDRNVNSVKHLDTREIPNNSPDIFNENGLSQLEENLKLNYYSYQYITLANCRSIPIEDLEIEKMKTNNFNKKRLSPFSFSFTGGYINEQNTRAKIVTENVHKDALKLFEAATGKGNNGEQISMMLGYRIKNSWDIRIGLNYLKTANFSATNYTYYEVPLYNTDGKIIGYGTRPVNLSPKVNQNTKTENKTYTIPIQLFTMLGTKNKWSVWGGIGSEIKLHQQYNTQLFSFEKGRMETLNKQQFKEQKIIPTAQLLLNYQYKPQWHFLFQIQSAFKSQNFYLDEVHYRKSEWAPSIKLGIQFNPLIQ